MAGQTGTGRQGIFGSELQHLHELDVKDEAWPPYDST